MVSRCSTTCYLLKSLQDQKLRGCIKTPRYQSFDSPELAPRNEMAGNGKMARLAKKSRWCEKSYLRGLPNPMVVIMLESIGCSTNSPA